MDIRRLAPDFAVSPQIAPEHIADLRAAGFATVICNRPDDEVPPDLQAAAMAAAAREAGMGFVENPIRPGMMTEDSVARQTGAEGPILAYCASGTRSTVAWLFARAAAGEDPDALLAAARQAGYALDMLRPQLEALRDGG